MTRAARNYLVRLSGKGRGFRPASWLPEHLLPWAQVFWLRSGLHPTIFQTIEQSVKERHHG